MGNDTEKTVELVDPTSEGAPELDRSELIAFVDSELVQIGAKTARQGTTRWTLVAAGGLVVWMIIHVLFPHRPPTEHIAVCFVAAALAWQVISMFIPAASPGPAPQRGRLTRLLSPARRAALLLYAAYLTAVVVAVSLSKGAVSEWAVWVSTVPLVLLIAASLLTVAMARMHTAPSTRPKGAFVRAIAFAFLLSVFVAFAVGGAEFGRVAFALGDLQAMELGTLLVALRFILDRLHTGPDDEQLAVELAAARRDLVLNLTPKAEVARRVDILLLGSRLGDLLSDEISAYVRIRAEDERLCKATAELGLSYQAAIDRLDVPACDLIGREISSNMTTLAQQASDVGVAWRRIKRRLKWFVQLNAELTGEASQIVEKTEQADRESAKHYAEMVARIQATVVHGRSTVHKLKENSHISESDEQSTAAKEPTAVPEPPKSDG